ncbi:putative membrane protein [Orientia tsutsugamushi str. UT144]|uniref:Putative membrane protein n=1 Tax=Orientia tsutsugamushi str. UT144 TaxID=1441384 RepID=A0A0F3RKR3_ORITS|nr:putative membrane protein [Orientia tsutsugamushi str. UT144]
MEIVSNNLLVSVILLLIRFFILVQHFSIGDKYGEYRKITLQR